MAVPSFHLLRVSEIREETPEAISIQFDVPSQLKEAYDFKPGQYLTLRRQINGEEVRRSYSICAAPDDNELRVAVKILKDGKFSNFAHQELKVGDEMEVMPPLGKFTPRENQEPSVKKNYLAFVAGSGITPVMSIMKSVLKNQPESTFTLVYGNKNRSNVIFKEGIEGLKNKFMERLVIHYLFTREAADTAIYNGRINAEKVKAFQKFLIDLDRTDEVFICGPEEMILDLRSYFLDKLSWDSHRVHFELFSSPDQPSQQHSEWQEKAQQIDPSKQSKVIVHLDGSAHEMQLGYNARSILDQALMEGLDLPYACKGGVCCTCRAKLLEGEVDMEVNYGLEPEEIEQNFILTCQAHPRSDKVVVDFDVK